MTDSTDSKYKFFEALPEIFFWYVKDLESGKVNELSFDITNIVERDRVDETVVTLELDNFSSRISDEKNSAYWLTKQPYTQNSGYNKLKLVVCYGHPDWMGRKNESKSITFDAKDMTVFLFWNVSDIAIIDSIKSNLSCHKRLSLYVVLNENDQFFKEDNDVNLKQPTLRSFSLSFE